MYPAILLLGYIFCIFAPNSTYNMAKATKFQFVLKSEKDKSKAALLYVMFSLDKRYKISLMESVPPIWWDK